MPASIQVPRSAWLRRAVGSVVQAVADYRVVVGVLVVCVVATWIANDRLGVHPSSADIERGTRRPDLTPTPEDPPARRPQPKPSPNASRPPPNTASRPSRPGSPDSERDTEFWPGRALWVFCGDLRPGPAHHSACRCQVPTRLPIPVDLYEVDGPSTRVQRANLWAGERRAGRCSGRGYVRPERILFGSSPDLEACSGALEQPVVVRRTVAGWVREWLGPKSRSAGWEPATLDDRDVPGCPPGPA